MSKIIELKKKQDSITIPAWNFKEGNSRIFTTVGTGQVRGYFYGINGIIIQHVGHLDEGEKAPVYYYSADKLTGPMLPKKFNSELLSDTAKVVREGSDVIMHRLKKFESLQEGWDSYTAKPIDLATRVRAMEFFSKLLLCLKKENRQIVPIPFVSPVADGSIQFEWKTCYKELIHSISIENDIFEYLKIEKVSTGEKEQEGMVFSLDELVEVVADALK